MKEIRETKMVEQTTVKFIANDGKEFATENECKVYEMSLRERGTEAMFGAISVMLPDKFADWYRDAAEIRLVTIKSESDWITTLAAYNNVYDNQLKYIKLDEYMAKYELSFPFSVIICSDEDYVDIYGKWLDKTKFNEYFTEMVKDMRENANRMEKAFGLENGNE